jgi:hypothetical protein
MATRDVASGPNYLSIDIKIMKSYITADLVQSLRDPIKITPQLKQTAADGSSSLTKPQRLWSKDGTPAAERGSCCLQCQTALPIGRSWDLHWDNIAKLLSWQIQETKTNIP